MKRTTLISASLLLAFTGCTCGQSWRPNILARINNRLHGVSNVGAPCDAGCQNHNGIAESSIATGGCESCAANSLNSMNYGGIEGQAIDSHEGVPLGSYNSIPSGSYVGETYPSRTYASQSYPSASIPIGQPTAVRMGAERILPKPAN